MALEHYVAPTAETEPFRSAVDIALEVTRLGDKTRALRLAILGEQALRDDEGSDGSFAIIAAVTWLEGEIGALIDRIEASHLADEKAAWESSFPNIPYDWVTTCAAANHPNEAALYDAWSLGRVSIR